MKLIMVLVAACLSVAAHAGVVDPDCTAEKAAKSAATKAVVGVGGRCTMAEAATDSAKKSVGIEEKGPLKKKDTPAEKVKDAVK